MHMNFSVPLRRAVLLGAPLILGLLEVEHSADPQRRHPATLTPIATWWTVLHVAQIPCSRCSAARHSCWSAIWTAARRESVVGRSPFRGLVPGLRRCGRNIERRDCSQSRHARAGPACLRRTGSAGTLLGTGHRFDGNRCIRFLAGRADRGGMGVTASRCAPTGGRGSRCRTAARHRAYPSDRTTGLLVISDRGSVDRTAMG